MPLNKQTKLNQTFGDRTNQFTIGIIIIIIIIIIIWDFTPKLSGGREVENKWEKVSILELSG